MGEACRRLKERRPHGGDEKHKDHLTLRGSYFNIFQLRHKKGEVPSLNLVLTLRSTPQAVEALEDLTQAHEAL